MVVKWDYSIILSCPNTTLSQHNEEGDISFLKLCWYIYIYVILVGCARPNSEIYTNALYTKCFRLSYKLPYSFVHTRMPKFTCTPFSTLSTWTIPCFFLHFVHTSSAKCGIGLNADCSCPRAVRV